MNTNDQIHDMLVFIRWRAIWVLGILLILWSLISLGPAYDRVQVKTAIDYFHPLSCESFSSSMPNARIAYCINYKLIENDTPLFNNGATYEDEFTDREINIRRQGQTLFINNQPLQIGERYNAVRRHLFNPWLMIATHIDCYLSYAGYVNCDANEVPQGNPLGAIILFGGIGLVILGNRGIKIAFGQYVMQPTPVPLKIKARDIALGFFGWVVFNSIYVFVLYRILGPANNLDRNPLPIWYLTIIALPALYIMKRYNICAGVALAVITNVGIWIGISMFLIEIEQERFRIALFGSGIPLPIFPLLGSW